MVFRTRIFVIVLSLAVLLFVINLVRTKKLKEQFALLWMLTAIILVIVPLSIDFLDTIAYALGVEYPPALMLLIAFLGVLFILFQFSISISRFTDQIKVLTQDLAILTKRVYELEARLAFPEKARQGQAEPKEEA